MLLIIMSSVCQMLHDLNTYLHKAIPDTKLTIRKYLDVKFEYLVRNHRGDSSGVFMVMYFIDLLMCVCVYSVVLSEGEGDG